jgi:hypothetical protein
MKLMTKHMAIGAALTLLLFVDLSTANAQTKSTDPTPIGRMVSGLNPMNWKLPNFREMLPAQEEKARIKKKKDGLFDEVTQTASRSWNRTKAVLNPQKLNPINFFPASARTPSSKQTQKAEPGFFRSLFTPAEPPADNSTVTDFLRQSRPSP